MAASRSKRSNAGNRMSKLIEEHVEDESEDNIYNTLYGGFKEEEDDQDYKEEEQEEDIVDSDFSLSENENDEQEADSEDEKKKRRKKKVSKKRITAGGEASKDSVPRAKKPRVKKVIQPFQAPEKGQRMRATTMLKAHQAAEKKKLQNVIRRHPTMPQMRRLTQEELLAEAQITEEQNLASLAQFLKIEAEKKANKAIKIRYQGPIIRFHSSKMPLIDDVTSDSKTQTWCSRNFLEFTDTKNFPRDYFPSKNVKYPGKTVCAVTGLPAKYKDPLTGLPYATADAFKYIRQHRKRLKDEMVAKRDFKRKRK